jgi:heme oxygenase
MHMTLSEKLKTSTLIEHQDTEKLLVERIKSVHSKEGYVQILKIFYGFFAPVEQLVRQFITSSDLPDLPKRSNVAKIKDDLKALNYLQPITLSAMLPNIENQCHAAGAMYVQEGSTLGGRHIAKMIAGRIDSPEGTLTFFQGYKDMTDEMWEAYKAYLNSTFITESDSKQVINGAKQTFEKMKEWILVN